MREEPMDVMTIRPMMIRLMTEADVPAVYAIVPERFSQPWAREDLRAEARGENGAHYVVAVSEGKVLGYGGFRQVLDEAHIMNIAVAAEHRGQGIGRRLMEGLLSLCPPLGILYITLEVRRSNAAALRLYEAVGFSAAGIRPGYYEKPREDAVIMWKQLDEREKKREEATNEDRV